MSKPQEQYRNTTNAKDSAFGECVADAIAALINLLDAMDAPTEDLEPEEDYGADDVGEPKNYVDLPVISVGKGARGFRPNLNTCYRRDGITYVVKHPDTIGASLMGGAS